MDEVKRRQRKDTAETGKPNGRDAAPKFRKLPKCQRASQVAEVQNAQTRPKSGDAND
jgi:hypothetical protein